MRCPDCAKMVSYDDPNIDGISCDLGGIMLDLGGEMILPCSECGQDLASASMESSLNIDELFDDEERQPDEANGETYEYELDGDPDLEAGDTGGSRFKKKYYTVTATGTVKRLIKNREGEVVETQEKEYELEAREQASAFESVV